MNQAPLTPPGRCDSAAPSSTPGTPQSMEDDLIDLDQHLISLHGSAGQIGGTSPAELRLQDRSVFSYNIDAEGGTNMALSLTLSRGPAKSFVTGRAYILEPEPEHGMDQAQAQDQEHINTNQLGPRSPSRSSKDGASGVVTPSSSGGSHLEVEAGEGISTAEATTQEGSNDASAGYGTWRVIYEHKFDDFDTDMLTAEDLATWAKSLATEVLKRDSDKLSSDGGIPSLSEEQKDHVLDLRDHSPLAMAEYALARWPVSDEAGEGDEA